jgi:hypothetical protein
VASGGAFTVIINVPGLPPGSTSPVRSPVIGPLLHPERKRNAKDIRRKYKNEIGNAASFPAEHQINPLFFIPQEDIHALLFCYLAVLLQSMQILQLL